MWSNIISSWLIVLWIGDESPARLGNRLTVFFSHFYRFLAKPAFSALQPHRSLARNESCGAGPFCSSPIKTQLPMPTQSPTMRSGVPSMWGFTHLELRIIPRDIRKFLSQCGPNEFSICFCFLISAWVDLQAHCEHSLGRNVGEWLPPGSWDPPSPPPPFLVLLTATER